VFVRPEDAPRALRALRAAGERPRVVGRAVRGRRRVTLAG
jgi:hypothetical protein